ncbi:Short-chain dehydrogenase/reductase SDR [Dillenia turbinata]|uniref:Short-chain dehydrogenase/reductase SDR n=1 Tax=Dillenia turbinata TaxID=194707 RepID=A0AAN8VDI4_9MAGN
MTVQELEQNLKEGILTAVVKSKKNLFHANVEGIACDVCQPNDVEKLANFAVNELGSNDIWINNAGTNKGFRPLLNFSDEDIKQVQAEVEQIDIGEPDVPVKEESAEERENLEESCPEESYTWGTEQSPKRKKLDVDLNIGIALWLVAVSDGWLCTECNNDDDDDCECIRYKSATRILLVGCEADEQCASYSRHRTKYREGSLLWRRFEDLKI